MNGDWIKAHRSLMDSAIWSDDWLVRLWMWCLFKANYKPAQWRGETVNRGQFITGRMTASDELSVAPSKWYRGMMRLAELGYIAIEANSVWTRVTVCKYETYQDGGSDERAANEQRLNSDRTANEQRLDSERTLEKECKKGRREELRESEREAAPVDNLTESTEQPNPQLLTPVEVARQKAAAFVSGWQMPTNAQEPRHREALAMWQAVRSVKHGKYLDEIQWRSICINRASWDADRWHEALLTSAADGTLNIALHQDDNRAKSERNGNARYHKARLAHPSDSEIPF